MLYKEQRSSVEFRNSSRLISLLHSEAVIRKSAMKEYLIAPDCGSARACVRSHRTARFRTALGRYASFSCLPPRAYGLRGEAATAQGKAVTISSNTAAAKGVKSTSRAVSTSEKKRAMERPGSILTTTGPPLTRPLPPAPKGFAVLFRAQSNRSATLIGLASAASLPRHVAYTAASSLGCSRCHFRSWCYLETSKKDKGRKEDRPPFQNVAHVNCDSEHVYFFVVLSLLLCRMSIFFIFFNSLLQVTLFYSLSSIIQRGVRYSHEKSKHIFNLLPKIH